MFKTPLLKRVTLWMLATATAAGAGKFLFAVASTYGLPAGFETLANSPLMLGVMFVFLLIAAAGADLVRYFIQAGIRVRSVGRLPDRTPDAETDLTPKLSDDLLVQRG